jgi:hypothetical protein
VVATTKTKSPPGGLVGGLVGGGDHHTSRLPDLKGGEEEGADVGPNGPPPPKDISEEKNGWLTLHEISEVKGWFEYLAADWRDFDPHDVDWRNSTLVELVDQFPHKWDLESRFFSLFQKPPPAIKKSATGWLLRHLGNRLDELPEDQVPAGRPLGDDGECQAIDDGECKVTQPRPFVEMFMSVITHDTLRCRAAIHKGAMKWEAVAAAEGLTEFLKTRAMSPRDAGEIKRLLTEVPGTPVSEVVDPLVTLKLTMARKYGVEI